MPLDVNIDDNNSTLIQYQGAWTYRAGSTRQWEGGVHATGQAGANATFNFRGYQVWVLGTIPAGSGTNAITVSIDGDTSGAINRTSNGSAVYDEVYFASPLLRDTFHTIVVTNRGSTTGGNSEFMLDRFEFKTEDEVPAFSTFSSATSASSSTGISSPSTASSSRSTTPWGGIIGGIVSFLLLIIAILLFVLWRKQRYLNSSTDAIPGSSNSPLTPTPFPAPSELPTSSNTSRLLPSILSEKSSHQETQRHKPGVTSTTITPSTSTAGPSSLPSAPNSPDPFSVEPLATSPNEKFDFPPPSYQPTHAAS